MCHDRHHHKCAVGKDAARNLCAAGQTVADRAVARRIGRPARRDRHCARTAQDAGAAALALDVFPRRREFRPDDVDLEGHARRAGETLHRRSAGSRRRADFQRRHPQMAVAAAERRCGRAAARGRVRLYPRDRSRHALCLLAGRLHAELLVLSHWHAAAGAQPHRRRDRRPGDGGARSPERLGRSRGTARGSSPTS